MFNDSIAHILWKMKEILERDEKCPSLPYMTVYERLWD